MTKFILRTFFTATRKNLCHFTKILCLSHKISKIFKLKIFSKKSYFRVLQPKIHNFCVNKKKFFFWPKKIFFCSHDNLCHSTQKLSQNWVTLQKNFMSWLGLIFDFKGGYHMTKLILRTFVTATRKSFKKLVSSTQNFENFKNQNFFEKIIFSCSPPKNT